MLKVNLKTREPDRWIPKLVSHSAIGARHIRGNHELGQLECAQCVLCFGDHDIMPGKEWTDVPVNFGPSLCCGAFDCADVLNMLRGTGQTECSGC